MSESSSHCNPVKRLKSLIVKYSARIDRNLHVKGKLNVGGDSNLNNVKIEKNLSVKGNAVVEGDVTIGGSIIGKLAFPTTVVTQSSYTVTSNDFVVLVNANAQIQLPKLSPGQEIVVKNITLNQPVNVVGSNSTTLFDSKNNLIILSPGNSVRFHLYNNVWYAIEAFDGI